MDNYDLLLFLSLLIIKHFLCDFVFQNSWMIKEKGIYGRLGGIVHSLIHGIGTFIVSITLTSDFSLSYILFGIDFLTHYHIDWLKSNLSNKYKSTDSKFWIWLGADQMAHYLVYVFILFVSIV